LAAQLGSGLLGTENQRKSGNELAKTPNVFTILFPPPTHRDLKRLSKVRKSMWRLGKTERDGETAN